MNQFKNNSDPNFSKVIIHYSETDIKERNKNAHILFLVFIIFVFFLSFSFSIQAQNTNKNKYLANFQDKIYIGLATEDNVEIIYTQCNEPIITSYFDISNGEPMFVMAGLYDTLTYQLISVKKENNKYILTYNDSKGQKQVAQLETDANSEKIYVTFEGMKMDFIVKEKMNLYRISDDCEKLDLASPQKKK